MSIRTIFEFNHDYVHKIKEDPEGFLRALEYYLNSASQREADALELFGVRRAWMGHHSTERKVATQHSEYKL